MWKAVMLMPSWFLEDEIELLRLSRMLLG